MREYGISREHVRDPVEHPMWHKLRDGIQPKKAREHLAKLAKDFPEEAKLFAPAVEHFIECVARDEEKRAKAKAEMEARRHVRNERQKQREELGVDLKSKVYEYATPETYREMRTGLKPLEAQVRTHLILEYTKEFDAMRDNLRSHNGDLQAAFPYRTLRGQIVPGRDDPPVKFYQWFDRQGATGIAPKADVADIILREATRDADEMLAGFSAKMAAKVDRELCNDQHNNENRGRVLAVIFKGVMWDDCTVTVNTDHGEPQVWETKVIWNRSVLGKDFNQWPTRRLNPPTPHADALKQRLEPLCVAPVANRGPEIAP